MTIRVLSVSLTLATLACAARGPVRTDDTLFASAGAELAREQAPDLYGRAKAAEAAAVEARRRKDDRAAEDHQTEARLWLAAAVTEAERVQLEQRRAELQQEEERWATQLARDQEACAIVAQDISRYEARAVALQEANRVAALSEHSAPSDATLDAVLTRVRLNLALAEALGATELQLAPLRERADAMGSRPARSGKGAEGLLLDTEALIGQMRAQWPEPRPGASAELVDTALVTGFLADRLPTGVTVRSERFFHSNGQVSMATVRRFGGLLSAFPHGPVVCQVSVPELRSRVWVQRVAQLVQRLQDVDESKRVSVGMVAHDALRAGAVQCTFAAYLEP